MSRKVFWVGVIVLTTVFIVAFIFLSQGENLKQRGEEGFVKRYEKFLYELYTSKEKVKGKYLTKGKSETNVFFILEVFLNTPAEVFLSQEWVQAWNTNDDVRLMLLIAKRELKSTEPMQYFEIEKLIFKMNYYRYVKLFEFSSIGQKDFLNLKKLVIYAHDNDFLDVAVDIATNVLALPFVDPEVMAYYGSTLTKYALVKNSPVDKVDFVSKGSYYIDKAVTEYPDFLVPRFVRVFNYLSLPSFFRKGKFVEEDLSLLLSNYQKGEKMKIVKNYTEVGEIEIPLVQFFEIKEKLLVSDILSPERKKAYVELIEKIEK